MCATEAETLLDVTAHFQALAPLQRVLAQVLIGLLEKSYAPKADGRADWIVRNLIPALMQIRGAGRFRRVATIGTGDGRDALALIEALGPMAVYMTDLDPAVVANAVENVRRNLISGMSPAIVGLAGDLLSPLSDAGLFDLIYENLPNIPAGDAPENDIEHRQNAATFHVEREEEIEAPAKKNLVSLHYLAQRQAKALLAPGGILLMSIGGRRPLPELLRALTSPDFDLSVVHYGWKIQSEAADVVRGYADYERRTGVEFSFYEPRFLAVTFDGKIVGNTQDALRIAEAIAPRAMTAAQALTSLERGEDVAHTVVMLAATLGDEGRKEAGETK